MILEAVGLPRVIPVLKVALEKEKIKWILGANDRGSRCAPPPKKEDKNSSRQMIHHAFLLLLTTARQRVSIVRFFYYTILSAAELNCLADGINNK